MSLEILKREAAALAEPERRELFLFLANMRDKKWSDEIRQAARCLDDPDPNQWLTLDEVCKRLDEIPPPER